MRIPSSFVLVLVAASGPAFGQTFVKGVAQIPSGSPFNASFSENVDFADIDLDGDLDAAFADGGDMGNDQNRLWVNQGYLQGGTIGIFLDDTAARFPAIQDSSRDIEFADFDADGDVDLDVANHSTISLQTSRFWINQGLMQGGALGFFVDETATRWLGLGAPGSSIPASQLLVGGGFYSFAGDHDYGDLDGDGDLDLVHSTYGSAFGGQEPTRVFLNDGTGHFGEFNPSGFQLPGLNIPPGSPALWAEGIQTSNTLNSTGLQADIASSALDIDLGDIDGDLDLDLLHGARQEAPRMFSNRLVESGSPIFRDVTSAAFQSGYTSGNGHYEQEMGDFDNDNDLDIYGLNWFNNFTDNTLRNQGNGTFGNLSTVVNSAPDDNEADFGDFDNDGDLDVYVANFAGQDRLYRNSLVPAGNFFFGDATGSELPSMNGIALDADWTDIDDDGDQDILVATNTNQPNVLLVNQAQQPDTHAPRAVALEQASDRVSSSVPTRVRVQVYDNAAYYLTQYADVKLEFRVNGDPWYPVPMASSGGQVFRGEIPGAMIGTIDYRVRATDRNGNVGVSAIKSFLASDGGCNGTVNFYCTAKPSSIPGCVPHLATDGVPSVSAAAGFTVGAIGMPGGQPGLFLYTTNGQAAVPAQTPFGFLCLGSGVLRVGAQIGNGTIGVCNGTYLMDFNTFLDTQVADPALVAGATVDMQLWYRDPPNPGGANFSSAVGFVLCP